MRNLLLIIGILFSAQVFAAFDHNMGDHLTVLDLIPVASVTATANGTGVDLQQYAGQVAVVADVGAATAGSSPTMDLKIQDSADNSSFADVTGGAFTQVTNAASVQKIVLNKDSLRRYIRIVKTIGGTSSPAFPVSVKGFANKKYLP